MVQIQDKLGTRQVHLKNVLQQLTVEYKTANSERMALSKVYLGTDEKFSLTEELELLTIDICGYANQIKNSGTVQNIDLAIAQLRELNVLGNVSIIQFYGDTPTEYPKIQAYIRLLDYLRLLTLEYAQNHRDSDSLFLSS